MRSADEVIQYLEHLQSTMQYLGVSDCRLQEGSMRADVNLYVLHAMGTSKAMEMGEIEGAMSSLSIAVSGLMTVVVSLIFSHIY